MVIQVVGSGGEEREGSRCPRSLGPQGCPTHKGLCVPMPSEPSSCWRSFHDISSKLKMETVTL